MKLTFFNKRLRSNDDTFKEESNELEEVSQDYIKNEEEQYIANIMKEENIKENNQEILNEKNNKETTIQEENNIEIDNNEIYENEPALRFAEISKIYNNILKKWSSIWKNEENIEDRDEEQQIEETKEYYTEDIQNTTENTNIQGTEEFQEITELDIQEVEKSQITEEKLNIQETDEFRNTEENLNVQETDEFQGTEENFNIQETENLQKIEENSTTQEVEEVKVTEDNTDIQKTEEYQETTESSNIQKSEETKGTEENLNIEKTEEIENTTENPYELDTEEEIIIEDTGEIDDIYNQMFKKGYTDKPYEITISAELVKKLYGLEETKETSLVKVEKNLFEKTLDKILDQIAIFKEKVLQIVENLMDKRENESE